MRTPSSDRPSKPPSASENGESVPSSNVGTDSPFPRAQKTAGASYPRFKSAARSRKNWRGGGSTDPYYWERLEEALNTRLFDADEAPLPSFDIGLSTIPGFSWRKTLFHLLLSALFVGQGTLAPGAMLSETMGICAFHEIALASVCGASWTVYCLYLLSSRLVHTYRRPSYYNAEADRRAKRILAQRSASRRVRHRSSLLLPPTKAELLAAWAKASKRGATEEKLKLGAMMATIEAVVENGLLRDATGTIVGRRGGVKEWLFRNCNALAKHYSALMHYKALADKVQRVCKLDDPYPVAALFGEEGATITVGPEGVRGGEAFEVAIGGTTLRVVGAKISVGPKAREEFRAHVGPARAEMTALGDEIRLCSAMKSTAALEALLYRRLGLVRERRLRSVRGTDPRGSRMTWK